MTVKVILKNVRIAFANDLFVSKPVGDNGDLKFGCTFLIDPKDPQIKTVNEAIEKAFTEKFGAKAPIVMKAARATEKAGLRDGDLKSYAGYPGNLYIGCSNSIRPTVIDQRKNPIAASDGKLYSGCYVNASININAYDHPKGGKGISAYVNTVQLDHEGEAFASGGNTDDSDAFDIVEGADADSLA